MKKRERMRSEREREKRERCEMWCILSDTAVNELGALTTRATERDIRKWTQENHMRKNGNGNKGNGRETRSDHTPAKVVHLHESNR
jgi:hypothetical protein